MNCFFVPIVEEICDFSGPVLTLMVFGLVSSDDVIHGAHVASELDIDGVSGLALHLSDVVASWADFIGADCSD
jgi:hypothetical protein